MNVTRLASAHAVSTGGTVAEIVRGWNAVRALNQPPTLVWQVQYAAFYTLYLLLSQAPATAPRDYFLSSNDVWNIKLLVNESRWKLAPEVLESIATIMSLPEKQPLMFMNQAQVTATNVSGARVVSVFFFCTLTCSTHAMPGNDALHPGTIQQGHA